jgi:hypothetical protein
MSRECRNHRLLAGKLKSNASSSAVVISSIAAALPPYVQLSGSASYTDTAAVCKMTVRYRIVCEIRRQQKWNPTPVMARPGLAAAR